ncbi:MAG TPA: iron-sulfur cluster assembly accessory protein [Gammaproteobacteria bacterium]|nr:iron-sulfur cluster assembly accessory protein [Gammaproteobacteria bacterium]
MSTNHSESIISITDDARNHLRPFLADLGETAGISIGVKKTGCSGFSYLVDVARQPRPDDICATINQIPVFLAADCVNIIRGTVINFVDKGSGQRQLVFDNPNANGLCGCGESFTIKADT